MQRLDVVVAWVLVGAVSACKEDPVAKGAPSKPADSARQARGAPSAAPPPEKPHDKQVLAKLHKPKWLALEGDRLFVADVTGGDVKAQDELMDIIRISTSGSGSEPVKIATKQREATGLIALGGALYFAVAGGKPTEGRIMRVPLDGGPPAAVATRVLAEAYPPLASDGKNLVYLGAGADEQHLDVMRLPLAGAGKAEKVASVERGAKRLFLAADATNVYWPEAGKLRKSSLAGGAAASDVAKVVYAWSAVSDGSRLFFSDSPGDGMGSLRAVPTQGGAEETLVSNLTYPVALATDETSVFVVNLEAEEGSLHRTRKTGTGTAVILLQGLKHPDRVVVDATSVYWTNVGDGTVCKTTK